MSAANPADIYMRSMTLLYRLNYIGLIILIFMSVLTPCQYAYVSILY